MVKVLFFCTTLAGRREGHALFVQQGAEASDSGVEAVKRDPNSSCEDHYERMDSGEESTESRSVLQLFRISSVIRQERCTSVVFVK